MGLPILKHTFSMAILIGEELVSVPATLSYTSTPSAAAVLERRTGVPLEPAVRATIEPVRLEVNGADATFLIGVFTQEQIEVLEQEILGD